MQSAENNEGLDAKYDELCTDLKMRVASLEHQSLNVALKEDINQLEKYLKSFVNMKDIIELKELVMPKLKET